MASNIVYFASYHSSLCKLMDGFCNFNDEIAGVCKAANKGTKKKDINICSHKIQKLLREMPLVDEVSSHC